MSYKDINIVKTPKLTTFTKNNMNNSIYPCIIFCPILFPNPCQKPLPLS